MNKIAPFEKLLEKFETDQIRDYCRDMIELIGDDIFTMPSSTSLKYHNATQCQPHGQLYHILMFAEIMNYMLGLKYIKENVCMDPTQRDLMRCTPIFHDALKCGTNGSKYTVHEHPMLAGEWVRTTTVEHDIPQKMKDWLAKLCESHSGEWTTSKKSAVVLPEPRTTCEFMVHLSDYLSSRANIDMIYDDDVIAAIEGIECPVPDFDPTTYTLHFGKHKDQTLEEINAEDHQYLEWLRDNTKFNDLKAVLKEYLG